MFVESAQLGQRVNYYYRPSMIAMDAPQQVAPNAGLGQVSTPENPSGKTWRDFLPRDWYDSAVYRNILDMLNTLDVTRQNVYNGLLGQFLGVRVWRPTVWDSENGGGPGRLTCNGLAALYGPGGLGSPEYKAFWGWAHTQTPAGQGTVAKYIYERIFECTGPVPEYVKDNACLQQKLKAAGYVEAGGVRGNYGAVCPPDAFYPNRAGMTHNQRVKDGLGYSTADVVNLVRSLDWEYNRVHLPLPFNLRQWATRYNELSMDKTGIGLSQRVFAMRDLQKWITIMREKTRQAIDASNLAVKVAEESLRKENARIIKEREAERQAREAERLKQIEEERAAAQLLLEEERKKLAEEMQAMIAAEKEAALKAAQDEIRTIQDQSAVAPAGTVQPVAPKPAPAPVPAQEFAPPAVITPTPKIAPEPSEFLPVEPAPRANTLPLIIGGIAALFMFS